MRYVQEALRQFFLESEDFPMACFVGMIILAWITGISIFLVQLALGLV